jgi:anti-sigma-K factor RskA
MLHDLENNEAILLMYLAGELPPDDQIEVEQQLASDEGLRAEFDRLRETHAAMKELLSAANISSQSEETAVRQTVRAMVRFQLEHREKQDAVVEERRRRLRLPTWIYPFAAAAMLIIAYVAWWGFSNNSNGPGKLALQLPDSNTDEPGGIQSEMQRRGLAPLSSLGVDDGDRELLALAPGSYDVASMFDDDDDDD